MLHCDMSVGSRDIVYVVLKFWPIIIQRRNISPTILPVMIPYKSSLYVIV